MGGQINPSGTSRSFGVPIDQAGLPPWQGLSAKAVDAIKGGAKPWQGGPGSITSWLDGLVESRPPGQGPWQALERMAPRQGGQVMTPHHGPHGATPQDFDSAFGGQATPRFPGMVEEFGPGWGGHPNVESTTPFMQHGQDFASTTPRIIDRISDVSRDGGGRAMPIPSDVGGMTGSFMPIDINQSPLAALLQNPEIISLLARRFGGGGGGFNGGWV